MSRTSVVLLALLVLLAPACRGGSIYARRRPCRDSIYGDDTAHRVGDLLTVIIQEEVEIESDDQRTMTKETSKEADLAGSIGRVGNVHVLPTLAFDMSSSNEFRGTTGMDSDRSMEDRVSVMVIDVLPNGNLVLSGRRSRKVNGDDQVMRVSGIARPSDITFANTIFSERIAEFKVIYEGKGQEQSFNNPGFVNRLLNFIWPW